MNRVFHITKNHVMKPFFMVVDFLLPPRCTISGEIVEYPGALAPKAWAELDFISDPCCVQCGMPFDFKIEETVQCGACLEEAPYFDKSRSALVYNDKSKKAILGFKHSDQTHASISFANLMTRAGNELIEKSDIIIPVPLHPKRLWFRRYNQAALLAKDIAKKSNKKSVLDLLKRIHHTPTQGLMNKSKRKENVKNAFAVNPKFAEMVHGKTILVVDDVFTTGATLNACAQTLKKAGAKEVYTLCLARVCKK